MHMRLFLPLLLLSSALFAYTVNDTLSEPIQKKLQLDPQKITIVDFFASWCDSCKKEIPHISAINKTLDTGKYEILGIDVDKKLQDGIAFQEALKAKGDLNFRVINDPENTIVKAFNPIGMPALYYIKDHKVLKVLYGAIDNIDNVILRDLKALE
ncbi:MAG: TlpA family protein disulfide reductase [Sulfurimonas sp.]|nr:MAG: TlpA family protein disulfide reductase [Sulfurimonas sp.]